MGLWGATDADESKPKNLTTAEKKEVFASLRLDDISQKGLSLMVDRILQTANNRIKTL